MKSSSSGYLWYVCASCSKTQWAANKIQLSCLEDLLSERQRSLIIFCCTTLVILEWYRSRKGSNSFQDGCIYFKNLWVTCRNRHRHHCTSPVCHLVHSLLIAVLWWIVLFIALKLLSGWQFLILRWLSSNFAPHGSPCNLMVLGREI